VDSLAPVPFCYILAASQVGLRYRGKDGVYVLHFAFRSIDVDVARGEVRSEMYVCIFGF
jgi:hypothetical protein